MIILLCLRYVTAYHFNTKQTWLEALINSNKKSKKHSCILQPTPRHPHRQLYQVPNFYLNTNSSCKYSVRFEGEYITEHLYKLRMRSPSSLVSCIRCIYCSWVYSFSVIQFQETEREVRECRHDSSCIAERSQETAEHELIWDKTHLPLRSNGPWGRSAWSLLHISGGAQTGLYSERGG